MDQSLIIVTLPMDTTIMDDFFLRALLAGIGVALLAAPLGCVIVWRRMAYFGDTLAHSALLGVAFGFLLNINITVTVFAVAMVLAVLLLYLQRQTSVPSDALLGLMSHGSLALGLVAVSAMTWLRTDLMGFLVGDILAVSATDVVVILVGGTLVLIAMAMVWKSLLFATVSPELAQVEGASPQRSELIFMLLMAIVIALSIKVIGVLLVTALLIIPAATARRFAGSPEHMVVLAAAFGVVSVIAGLFGSLHADVMSGPAIVVAAIILFALSLTPFVRFLSAGEDR